MQGQVGIYLVAENRLFRESLAGILRKKPDLCVLGANSSCEESLQQIVELSPPILLIDSASAAERSFAFLRALREKASALKILVIGGDEDEEFFLHAATAGIAGYVLKDASAADVVTAVRAAAREEAVCPPRLCLALFKYVARQAPALPNAHLRHRLGLTRREQQLLPLIAQGLTNKEIAAQLCLSEQTVKNHIHRMLRKAGVGDRLVLVETCWRSHSDAHTRRSVPAAVPVPGEL